MSRGQLCGFAGCGRHATHAPVLLVWPAGMPRNVCEPVQIMIQRPRCFEHAAEPLASWFNESMRDTARQIFSQVDRGVADVYDVGLERMSLLDARFVDFEKRLAVSELPFHQGRLN